MNIIEIIEKKKIGSALTKDEIEFFVNGVTDETLPDYQVSALLMAICLKGMDARETHDLTMSMANSGDMIDLSKLGLPILDKHSTGGVGDKTTLIIGPIMAALGVPVGKMSGRGLGITGGTIDKLESIPGFSSDMSDDEFVERLTKVGFVDAAQTKNLAPADKRLYALRDVTGTVNSIPLIASSIMSKKLASGADAILLDVKCGSGAFMNNKEDAVELAETMIDIGFRAGKKVVAIISDMNQPLGYTVGNVLEVKEAAEFLSGKKREPRLYELVINICSEMYNLFHESNVDLSLNKVLIDGVLESGEAFDKLKEFIESQGGESSFVEDTDAMCAAKYKVEIVAAGDGLITGIDAGLIGKASLELGAGRLSKDDTIDMNAGIEFIKLVGDKVKSGDVIAYLYSDDNLSTIDALKLVSEAITINDYSSAEVDGAELSFYDGSIILDVVRD